MNIDLKLEDFQAWAETVSHTYAEQRFMSGNGTKCLTMVVFMTGRIEITFDERTIYSGTDFSEASQAYAAVCDRFEIAFPPNPLRANAFFAAGPAAGTA